MPTYQAFVRCKFSTTDSPIAKFICSAGLGVTGLVSEEVIAITYREGVIPDTERVTTAMQNMQKNWNEAHSEVQLVEFTILGIYERISE
jgi:hypothetical protein